MNTIRRSRVGRSIVDKTIDAREPQLIKLPIPIPSIPILAPIISPIIGGSDPDISPSPTAPANTPLPTQPTPPPAQPTSPPAQPTLPPAQPTLPPAQPTQPTPPPAQPPPTAQPSPTAQPPPPTQPTSPPTQPTSPPPQPTSPPPQPTSPPSQPTSPTIQPLLPAQPTPPPTQPTETPPTSPRPFPGGSVSPPSGSTPSPNLGAGASPPSGSTPSPSLGGDGSPSPVPAIIVPGSRTSSISTPLSEGPPNSPTIGGATPAGITNVASPTSGSISGGGGEVTPTTSNSSFGSDNLGIGASTSSAPLLGSVTIAGGTPQGSFSPNSGGSNTLSAGGSSSTATYTGSGTGHTTSVSGAEKEEISTGAIAAIVVIFIALLLALLIFLLRHRSRARRYKRTNTWWFSKKRTSQTYGDRNSTEILVGSRSTRGSFASTTDHYTYPNDAPAISPPPPMAEVGRVNASLLQLAIDPSRYHTEVPDNRFSIGSNQSENSQYLFVNLQSSLEDLTPVTGQSFSPSPPFAFPKPPPPVGNRIFAHSRLPSTSNGAFRVAATMKRPNSDDPFFPSLSAVPSTSAVSLIGSDPFASDPVGDNNPFEDAQCPAAPTIFKEIIRQPFQRTREDEITVSIGECVHVIKTFDDGWAYVVKVPATDSGRGDNGDLSAESKGLIPIDCLMEHGQDLHAFIPAKRVSSDGGGDAIIAM